MRTTFTASTGRLWGTISVSFLSHVMSVKNLGGSSTPSSFNGTFWRNFFNIYVFLGKIWALNMSSFAQHWRLLHLLVWFDVFFYKNGFFSWKYSVFSSFCIHFFFWLVKSSLLIWNADYNQCHQNFFRWGLMSQEV